MKTDRTLLMFVFFSFTVVVSVPRNADKVLSRQKRYLVFPEGSSLSVAICMTAQTGITPGEIYTEGINWGISYELPNDTKDFNQLLGKPKELMQRRHRRDLYHKMTTIMNSMGYNGGDCIVRALCEASRNLKPKGDSLLDEILRIVFRYPRKHNRMWEEGEHHQKYYFGLEKAREDVGKCSEMFPECPFSLIDLALGYYSAFGYVPDT